MRVLIATFAERTHFFNLVPIAWALRTAGHEVRVASQPALVDTIVKTGLTAVSVGTDHTWQDVMDEMADDEDWGDRIANAFTDPDDIDYDGLVAFFAEETYSFKAFNDMMVDDLVTFARQWQPDLIIWENFTYAGPVAARVTGAAHARLLVGADVLTRVRQRFLTLLEKRPPEQRSDPMADWLSETLARFGHTYVEEITTGQMTIDQSPASMRLQLGVPTIPVRYVAYNGPAVVPDWVREPPTRPRVFITAGLTMRAFFGFDPIPIETLQAFGDLDVEIVATLVPSEGEPYTVPDNVRLVDFVPMHAILPTCAAIVHVGNVGSMWTALSYGVPQLMLVRNLFDVPVRAEMVSDLGAGLHLMPEEIDQETVRDNVMRLVKEPSFKAGAERLRQELLAEPAPNDVVSTLESLVAQNRAGLMAEL